MYRVRVKNPTFNDVRAGVAFHKGEAIVEDESIAKLLIELGYQVEKLDQPSVATTDQEKVAKPTIKKKNTKK